MSIARMGISRIEGRSIVMPLHHMVIDESGVHTFVAEHVLYLYTMDDMLQAFHSADLETRFDTDGLMGRGLYIAIKKGLSRPKPHQSIIKRTATAVTNSQRY